MAIDTITIDQFVANNGITLKAVRADRNPNMADSQHMDHWKVTLSRPMNNVVTLKWKTRDHGNGFDQGTTKGQWGEADGPGKRAFFPDESQHILYLFPDEIVSEKKTSVFVKLTVIFSMGIGHKGAKPTATEILACLASDASGCENAGSLEDWCSEYGYDTDSRKAEKTYKAVVHASKRLKNFLGDDLYQQLLWNTEKL